MRTASLSTNNPERAFKNLSEFLERNPGHREHLMENLFSAALLFSHSQFLASFCTAHPDIFFQTICDIETPLQRQRLSSSLKEAFSESADHMKVVRMFRKEEMLRITLRDILKKIDIAETMQELSMLADVIVHESLLIIQQHLCKTHGAPDKDDFAVIALGKLGSEELNYSSDIDLIFVYGNEEGETSGVRTPQGMTANRISLNEYYCKISENLNRFLSANTEDSFAYRVDLRLRPEGQRGSIALCLAAYETYYESWGRTWERAMLLRARPIAGDPVTGNNFMEMIKPFVYRKYLDFSAIDEIMQIKTMSDSSVKKNDIKRGFGGIREIEFFTHALQLMYAGKEPLLRERNTQRSLYRLMQKNFIGHDDYSALSENYIFLRTLEHRLQQLNDLQTHSLPVDAGQLEVLAKKMGFTEHKTFLHELESRRKKTRSIYDSLFKEKGHLKQKKHIEESAVLLDEELSDSELRDYVNRTQLKDKDRGMRNIQHIRNSLSHFQTLKSRQMLSEILPSFVDASLKSINPDMALHHLESFASMLGMRESYLQIFRENTALIPMLMHLFSQSEYLSKTIIRRPDYLEVLGHKLLRKKTLRTVINELQQSIEGGQSLSDAVRIIKQIEEVRLGILFLEKRIPVAELLRGLSKTAEADLRISLEQLNGKIAVISLGKLGGREMTFDSDMDLIFAAEYDVHEEDTKTAEQILRLLLSYTREGTAYKVDTRLRPEGTKGPLVSSLRSFRDYYSQNAAFWEFQALLKARPVAGDSHTGFCFMTMAKDILKKHGHLISASQIMEMRERIQKELAKEDSGYDLKLGYGGLEELEFTVQYLQLKNCSSHPFLLVQGTFDALTRLKRAGVLKKTQADFMKHTYEFYRTLESYLRLRGRDILKNDDEDILTSSSEFLGMKKKDDFIRNLNEKRSGVRTLYDLLVV